MKTKLIKIGLMSLLVTSLGACGEEKQGEQNKENQEEAKVEVPTIPEDTIFVDEIPTMQYGSSLDLSGFVTIGGNYYGYVVIKCTSLTPDIVTVNNDKPSEVIAVGVGEAKVKINIGGVDKEVTFNVVPQIKNIVINNPSDDFLLNDIISLDDYVSINVANPIGSKSDYIATVSRDSKDIVSIQGHMVKFTATGDFTIVIQDLGKSKTAYFKGYVSSKLQKAITEYTKTVTNDYSNVLAGNIITIHTDNYVFYPMKRMLGGSWEFNGLVDMEYEGYIEFSDGTLYQVVCGQNSDGYPDLDNLKFISKLNGGKEAYWNFDPINWNFLKQFKTHVDEEGNEDYIYANCSSAILDELIGTTYQIQLAPRTVDEIRIYFDEEAENNKLTVGFYLNDELAFNERFWDVNDSNYSIADSFVNNLNNKPAPIVTTSIVSKLNEIINAKNFTVTGRSYISDPNGNEMEYKDAIAAYLPLHTMYYTGGAKYVEDAMFIRNVQAFEVEGNTDKQKSHGFINKDGKVYEVNFEKDSKGNEVYNGAISLDNSPIVNSNGQQISFYGDNTSFKSLFRINFDDWNELDFLSESEKGYEFTIGKTSKKGSELLRNILNTTLPEFTEHIFPSNLYNNNFEAASAGSGIFKINEDGSLYFAYQVANIISEMNLSIRLSVEFTISDIGTTTLTEFDSLR
ncbi:MAG: hypothetical protein K6E21_04190 [Bacilli bacterium]|nr:hypothetical protein [Bacilli bacterium]